MEYLSTKKSIHQGGHNLICSCLTTRANILAIDHIFCPNLGSIQGKTTKTKHFPVQINKTRNPIKLLTFDIQLFIMAIFLNTTPLLTIRTIAIKLAQFITCLVQKIKHILQVLSVNRWGGRGQSIHYPNGQIFRTHVAPNIWQVPP